MVGGVVVPQISCTDGLCTLSTPRCGKMSTFRNHFLRNNIGTSFPPLLQCRTLPFTLPSRALDYAGNASRLNVYMTLEVRVHGGISNQGMSVHPEIWPSAIYIGSGSSHFHLSISYLPHIVTALDSASFP